MATGITFNQFQKELQNRGIDRHHAYFFSILFEAQLEQGKQLDTAANIIQELVKVVEQFSQLHEATQGRVNDFMKEIAGRVDGVTVTSEPGKGHLDG